VSQIPTVGDYFTFDMFGDRFVVVRGKDRIRVLSRVCLHRWAPIASGAGNVRNFVCPFHGWGYALDSRLIGAPHMENAPGFDMKSCQLPELRSEVVEGLGLIFVTYSKTAESISERLADLCERLKNWRLNELVSACNGEMDVPYNWKIQIETGQEAYHHTVTHPTTFGTYHPPELSWAEESRKGWTVCHSPPRLEDPDEVLTIGLPIFPHLEGKERRAFDIYLIYPLTRLIVFTDRIMFRRLTPVGPLRTKSIWHFFIRPEVARDTETVKQKFATYMESLSGVSKEDDAVCLMQQTGAASSFATAGQLCPLEVTLSDLAEYVRVRVGLA
jgi:phenylpropionate dioxygenase-like ring-hydroxylating dioxygenase large terminal subunit